MPSHDSPSDQSWQIIARKYDRRVHYTLHADLVSDDGERLLLRMPAGTAIHHHTRGWTKPAERLNDLYFWRERWYNVYVGYQPDGTLRGFYCNVGLPPIITDHTLSFVDLDIDVRIWPDNRFELLDLDEFHEHATTFGYPLDVQRAAYDAMLDILFRWRRRKSPFDLIG